MFTITFAQAIYSNHRLDTAYDGRYIVRLPNRQQVYAEDYARRLAEYEQNERSGTAPDDAKRV